MYRFKDFIDILKPKDFRTDIPDAPVEDYLYDSRKYDYGISTVFFALQTPKNDGHRYIYDLHQKGLRNFVVSQPLSEYQDLKNANFIEVENTLNALQTLAAFHRRQFQIPIIGITGSNGKTIVKEWLAQVLEDDFKICKNPHSYNSQLGVPISVLQLNRAHELGIFEAGISKPNEMIRLQNMIQPTIGIFTNIGTAHDAFFESTSQKISEKLQLFASCHTLIYCGDHREITSELSKNDFDFNLFRWGKQAECDLKITQIQTQEQRTFITLLFENREFRISIPFTDAASIENAMQVAAYLFLTRNIQNIEAKLAQLSTIEMRLELKEGINNCVLINDTYSADVNALKIALQFLNLQNPLSKKTLILSDILQADIAYEQLAELVHAARLDRFIGIGKTLCEHAGRFKVKESAFFETVSEFLSQIKNTQYQNEIILIKGSRIFQFEYIVQRLQKRIHETVLEVNLAALTDNLNYFKSRLNPATKIMAMVKANAYGSGIAELASELQNIDYLCVAYADEGIELRQKGIRQPVLVMNTDIHNFESIIRYRLEPEIFNFRTLDALEKELKRHILTEPLPIHIKIDSGMHRLGFTEEDMPELCKRIERNKNLKVVSVFSHLAAADDINLDNFTEKQAAYFERCAKKIQTFNPKVLKHLLNSSGIIRFPKYQYDMVRLGLGLYGFSPLEEIQQSLQNVMTLKTVISQIKIISAGETVGYQCAFKALKETKVGIIPVGYADGFSRKFSNNGEVQFKQQRVPIIGNICMDMTMIDLTGTDAREGDEIIIFGDLIPLSEWTQKAETIPYELLTLISRRVPRIYIRQ